MRQPAPPAILRMCHSAFVPLVPFCVCADAGGIRVLTTIPSTGVPVVSVAVRRDVVVAARLDGAVQLYGLVRRLPAGILVVGEGGWLAGGEPGAAWATARPTALAVCRPISYIYIFIYMCICRATHRGPSPHAHASLTVACCPTPTCSATAGCGRTLARTPGC
jgi:hypothetical protein